jgi:hypothetical protein
MRDIKQSTPERTSTGLPVCTKRVRLRAKAKVRVRGRG